MAGARTDRQRERRTERKMEELARSNRMGFEYKGKSGREKILEQIQKRIRWCIKKDIGLDSGHKRIGEIWGLAIAWAILVRPYDDTMLWAEKLVRREWKRCLNQ